MTVCSRWGARRGRRPARWRGAASGSRASNSAPNWPRPPARTSPGGRWRWCRASSRNGSRVSHTDWCTRLPRGTGSTPASVTRGPGRRCVPAVTWLSGERDTFSPRAATRSSARSRTSTTRSARGCRPTQRAAASRRTSRRPCRDRGDRALRGHRRPPLRLGARLPGRGVHRAAQHVLRPPGHAGLETEEVVRRDQAAARAAAGPFGTAALGCSAAGRPASRAQHR